MPARKQRTEPRTELARVLYEVRAGAGLTSGQMAQHCGLETHTQISQWETGKEVPGLIYLLRIGALAKGTARQRLVEVCRDKLFREPIVAMAEVRDMLSEVAGG